MKRSPGIRVSFGSHHLDGAARDVFAAQPDHSPYPGRHWGRIESLIWRESVEVSGQDVKGECVLLANQLLLYSVEQSAQLAYTLPLAPLREPRPQMKHEHTRQSVAERYLEDCVARSWRVAPRVVEHGESAEKRGRVRSLRSGELQTGETGEAFYDNGVPRLLKRHEVGPRRRDYFSDSLGAADAALADVVSEKPHVRRWRTLLLPRFSICRGVSGTAGTSSRHVGTAPAISSPED